MLRATSGALLLALLALLATSAVRATRRRAGTGGRPVLHQGVTLLVVAHPDDESMFFAPTVAALTSAGVPLHVLCLSTGNAGGCGPARRVELAVACTVLGVPHSRVMCNDSPDLQDGFHQVWAPQAVASAVEAAVAATKAVQVVTFDAAGVSGHPNHVATHLGVLHWRAGRAAHRAQTQLWALESPRLAVKFTGPLLSPLALRRAAASSGRHPVAVYVSPTWHTAARALACHATQAVWYRTLFITFASCAYYNTLRRLQ